MKMRPLQGRVAVREILPKQLGSIYVPDTYHENNVRKTTSHMGVVLAKGRPAETKGGVYIEADFKVGDTVQFVFDSDNHNRVQGGGATEQMRKSIWPADGLPCTWITQEEIIGVWETE